MTRLGALKSPPIGDWTDDNAGTGGQVINTNTGVKITELGVAIGTPVGCTMSAGTFTPSVAGKYRFNFSVGFAGGSSAQRGVYLGLSTAASNPGVQRYGLKSDTGDVVSGTCRLMLAAGQPVSVYGACYTAGGSVQVWRNNGCILQADWVGPYIV